MGEVQGVNHQPGHPEVTLQLWLQQGGGVLKGTFKHTPAPSLAALVLVGTEDSSCRGQRYFLPTRVPRPVKDGAGPPLPR